MAVPSQKSLVPSVASVTSVANDKDDNKMIPGGVHESPGICLTAEQNPQKTSARRPLKSVRPFIALNRVPYLQMKSVGSHCKSGRQKEGNEEKGGM